MQDGGRNPFVGLPSDHGVFGTGAAGGLRGASSTVLIILPHPGDLRMSANCKYTPPGTRERTGNERPQSQSDCPTPDLSSTLAHCPAPDHTQPPVTSQHLPSL
ncbi:hypothetical protein AGIG_G24253 [Arapaima gigas]